MEPRLACPASFARRIDAVDQISDREFEPEVRLWTWRKRFPNSMNDIVKLWHLQHNIQLWIIDISTQIYALNKRIKYSDIWKRLFIFI